MREAAHRNINFQLIAGVPHLCTLIICEAFEYSKMITSKGFLVTFSAWRNSKKSLTLRCVTGIIAVSCDEFFFWFSRAIPGATKEISLQK